MYRINEGTLDIPPDWQDRSINVIGSNSLGSGVTMTITRDDIPWGMAFIEYVDDQIRQAAEALKNFIINARRTSDINGHAAIEVECHWTARHSPIHQIITTVQNQQRALVLTASVSGEMSESQMEGVRRIVQTLRLDPYDA